MFSDHLLDSFAYSLKGTGMAQAARRLFGDDANGAIPLMEGFMAEKQLAARELPTSNDQHRTLTALVNWSIRMFTQSAKSHAGFLDKVADVDRLRERVEACWRYIEDQRHRLDSAMDQRDGYRAKVDKVDATMELLLARAGLVCNVDGEGRYVIEPAPDLVVLDAAIETNAKSGLLIPLKKKRSGWPKGKKRSTAKAPERKAAAKVKPIKKKARRKSK